MSEESVTTGWDHKSEWRRRGKHFSVTVSRHSVDVLPGEFDRGPHRWAVYAHVYPSHKLFDNFDVTGGMFQNAACNMPLHCGPSFFMVHRSSNDGSDGVSAIHVSADYDHLYDDYTHFDDDMPPCTVFQDAGRLFSYLEDES